jgi:hypothetical protein
MHRRCIQILPGSPRSATGSSFVVQDRQILIESGFVLDFGNALTWEAAQPASVISSNTLSSCIYSFFSTIDVSHARGFGSFIPQILSCSQGYFSDAVLQHAQPLVLEMARACREHQPSRIPDLAEKLIGLGAGLTPSGDDFLGGMLFALNRLQSAYPESNFTNWNVAPEPFRRRTHLISYTILNDLANGHAVAPLHALMNGLLMDEPAENLHACLAGLTSIGHSTGWDMLAGFMTGLISIPPSTRLARSSLGHLPVRLNADPFPNNTMSMV